MLGAYGRGKLNENGKLLLGFAEDKSSLSQTLYFSPPKGACPIRSKAPNCSKGQACLDYIRTKQADRRLIRCVNVRQPPLEAPESDHNLVYAKFRIPRKSAPNRRRRDNTKETPKLVDLRRFMTDPNLRFQVANAMVDALPPFPDGTCTSDIATDMADMLSTAAELVPRSKRPRGAHGWCLGPGVEAEMNEAWQQREEKVRIPRKSAPNRRRRDNTKETPKLVDLRRLMTDPNLRFQVANAMVDALPPFPDGTCISDIATDMADMLSTAAELVPRSKRPRGAHGWCLGPGVEAEMNAAWQQREEARRHLRAEPHSSNLRKVRKAAVLSLFWDIVRKKATRPASTSTLRR